MSRCHTVLLLTAILILSAGTAVCEDLNTLYSEDYDAFWKRWHRVRSRFEPASVGRGPMVSPPFDRMVWAEFGLLDVESVGYHIVFEASSISDEVGNRNYL